MWKKVGKVAIILGLIVFYAYFLVIDTTPNDMVIIEGEKIQTKSMLGFNLKNNQKTLTAAASTRRSSNEYSRYKNS